MADLSYCCPRCRAALESSTERYDCRSCGSVYPVIAGIADFRLYADPYIDIEADRAKGRYLAEEAAHLTFPELVARYYAITPEVLPTQASHFLAHHLAGVQRGRGLIERHDRHHLAVGLGPSERALDLGCGTGGFSVAVMERGGTAVGVDIAFRWLVVARRRFADAGLPPDRLVCACADYLPFPDDSFDLVVAENLLEHARTPAAVLSEAGRVRRPGGAFMARTVNRYALAPEPHVGLWGVGFLPRRWMDRYVRRFRGIPYEHIRLHSLGELRRLVRASGQADLRVRRPAFAAADLAYYPPGRQRLLRAYVGLGDRCPLARPPLTALGPYLDIVSRPAAGPNLPRGRTSGPP